MWGAGCPFSNCTECSISRGAFALGQGTNGEETVVGWRTRENQEKTQQRLLAPSHGFKKLK